MNIWTKDKQIKELASCLDITMNTLYKIMDDQLASDSPNQSLISIVGKTIAKVESYGKKDKNNVIKRSKK